MKAVLLLVFLIIPILPTLCNPDALINVCNCSILYGEGMIADCSTNSGFDIKCLARLPCLEDLNLSGNRLAEVPKELNSTGFDCIRRLDLSHNSISHLPSWKFDSMPLLQSLNLSHNQISTLPEDACRIRSVDLSYNNLTDMSNLLGIFKTKARIVGNPIRCACNSTIARRFYAKPTFSNLESIDCTGPGSDLAKPLAMQCNQDYNEGQSSSNWEHQIYLFMFLLIFITGIAMVCKYKSTIRG
ncbi:toll-like receptor 8 isoform X2 [Drosophila biarmipes]|uniref:toll-like receptor 8 isoform X2 n=1 Tax=Drosophila biarmipes TaxID=125945 RepID=UPI0021CCEAE6|nr:toll-like receptor 8 isoform X2 [Drosophila biarmipes]